MDTTTLLNELSQLVRLTDSASHLSEERLPAIYAAVETLMRESEGYLARATTAEAQLTRLLAAIYWDGGRFQDQHGSEQAVAHAITAVTLWRKSLNTPKTYNDTGEQ